jgi:uncharacterized DUF497 family protein
MKIFKWNSEKNEILTLNRGISFEEIVQRIQAGAKVIETEHPNKERYPNQKIMIVDLDGYAYLVPYVVAQKNEYFLKTIIPSRKATKKYLGGKNV